MATDKNFDLELIEMEFNKRVGPAKKSYEQARAAYEAALTKFLTKHVTGVKSFGHFHQQAWGNLADNMYGEVAIAYIQELDVLDEMVSEYKWWLDDGRFDINETSPFNPRSIYLIQTDPKSPPSYFFCKE